MFNKNY